MWNKKMSRTEMETHVGDFCIYRDSLFKIIGVTRYERKYSKDLKELEFSRMFRDKKILINGKPVTEEEFFKKYPTVHMPPELRVLGKAILDFKVTRYEFNIKKVKQWLDPRRNDTLIVFPEEVKIVSKVEALFHPDSRGFSMKTLATL